MSDTRYEVALSGVQSFTSSKGLRSSNAGAAINGAEDDSSVPIPGNFSGSDTVDRLGYQRCISRIGNDESRDWIISGTELIKALEGISDNGAPQGEAGGIMSRARGSAYIAGVADATSGTGWCGAGSVLPHELTDRVYTHLRSVTPERLKGSASTLVIETLAAIYPCPAN